MKNEQMKNRGHKEQGTRLKKMPLQTGRCGVWLLVQTCAALACIEKEKEKEKKGMSNVQRKSCADRCMAFGVA